MAGEIRRADIGEFRGQTSFQIVPPSNVPGMSYVLPPGGLMWQNKDNVARTFVIEIHSGHTQIEIFNTELKAGEGYAYPFEIALPADFDGIFGRVTETPTTQPTFSYNGRMEFDLPQAGILR